jgi:mxaA protein
MRRAPLRPVGGLLLVLLGGCSSSPDSAKPPSVTLNAPRDYGYVMGDIIDQTLRVVLPGGQSLDTTSLPQPGGVNEWLSVRGSRWDLRRDGPREIWEIHVAYQVFKGVREPEQAVIPPLTLRLAGSPAQELHSPAWPFTLVPVIPPEIKDEQVELREPLPAEPAETASVMKRWLLWLAGTACVIGLFGLRQFLRNRRARPFAVACRQLKATLSHHHESDELRAAARLLHRAFDQTFGETLFAGQIDRYCTAHPAFAPLKERLVGFFTLSQRLFFDLGGLGEADPATRDWLMDLGRRCAAAERKAL